MLFSRWRPTGWWLHCRDRRRDRWERREYWKSPTEWWWVNRRWLTRPFLSNDYSFRCTRRRTVRRRKLNRCIVVIHLCCRLSHWILEIKDLECVRSTWATRLIGLLREWGKEISWCSSRYVEKNKERKMNEHRQKRKSYHSEKKKQHEMRCVRKEISRSNELEILLSERRGKRKVWR